MPLATGTRLGPYEILEPLGAGGMGEVYRARDSRLEREVAVKVLRSEVASDPDRLRRFEREAKTVAALNHPHILTVHDVGTHEGTPYVVTELLEGETLRQVLKDRSPTQAQILTFAVQIARGLAAAHDKDMVHRDLKPENLFLTTDGRVKVLDFGLAKLTTREADFRSADTLGASEGHSTSPGVILGTVAYMSPEQARAHPLDSRSDIFSFGVVLYEMLARKHPFLRDTAPATLTAIVGDIPPDLASSGRGIPPALAGIVQRCLEKRREDRFRGTHDLALALEAVLQAPTGVASLQEVEERSPYPGLSSFTEKDAGVFFGREDDVETLWRKLCSRNLLAVIGPSGAGKTSFVRAGVLPLRPEGWAAIVCAPGRAPMRALARALAPELAGDTEALTQLPDFEETDVAASLLTRWRRLHDEALVVVDQFEELFTQSPLEAQASFAALLGRLARESDVHVLLSLRDDFLMRCHQHEPLARVFSELTPLDTLTREGLRRAVTEPARTRGYAFEDEALVAEMLDAVEGARGALPLLAFAVSRLWEKRDPETKCLTREAYEEIGGVAGALAQHAEQTLERIGSERQTMVREIFRNLVTSQGTRASSERAELLSIFPEREVAEAVLDELIDARLLTSYEIAGARGPDSGKAADAPPESRQRIEIVHESLLKAWPRLVWWQAQDEEGAHLRDQLKQAAHLWEEKDRSPDLLWSGAAFRELEIWRDRYPGQLTAVEEDFAHSMATRARGRKRLRTAAVATVILALAGVAIAINAAREEALESARRAEASRILALAELRLDEDPTEALAYTTASLEVADSEEARLFAMKVLWTAPPAFEVEGEGARWPEFSPDGRWLAAAGFTQKIGVWAETGERIATLAAHRGTPEVSNKPGWASDGLLVTGLEGGTDPLDVWAMPEGKRVRAIELDGHTEWEVAADRLYAETYDPRSTPDREILLLRTWRLPDGEAEDLGRVDWTALGKPRSHFATGGAGWAYAAGDTLRVRALPSRSGAEDRLLTRHDADIGFIDELGSRDALYSFDRGGGIRQIVFPSSGPLQVTTIPRPETASNFVAPERSGRWLVSLESAESRARVWKREAWPAARPLLLRRTGAWHAAFARFHPIGDWLVASTQIMTRLTFWPLRRVYPTVVDGTTSLLRPLSFNPDSRWLATGWSDETLRLWPVGEGMDQGPRLLKLPDFGVPGIVVFGPEGRHLVVFQAWADDYVVPLDGGPPHRLEGTPDDNDPFSAAVSPSGRRVATACAMGDRKKTLRVWDLDTGELQVLDLPKGESNPPPAGDVPAGKELFAGGVVSLAFADESTLYTGGDGGIRRWNLDRGTHELVAAARPGHFHWMQIDAERRTALVAEVPNAGGQPCSLAQVVDVRSGTARSLPEFGDCILWRALALDPSGTVAATGDLDGVIRVGRLDGGEPHILARHSGPVQYVQISPDLQWVASTGEDNTLRLWPMPDLDAPPLHTLPHDELLAKLKSLTNLRAVRDPESSTGWTIELGPFPGWKHVPTW